MIYWYKKIVITFIIILLMFGAIKIFFFFAKTIDEQRFKDKNKIEEVNDKNVSNLKKKSSLKGNVYVEDSKAPVPTNQWYSSTAFTETSEPIFAYPLAIKLNGDGFGISYPSIVSTPHTVFSSYLSDLKVVFNDKKLIASIVSYDDLSVKILQKNEETDVSKLQVTHGSPFVYVSVSPKESFKILTENLNLVSDGDGFVVFNKDEKYYAFFFLSEEMSVKKDEGKGLDVTVFEKEAQFSVAVMSNLENLKTFQQYALNPIIKTNVEFDVDGTTLNTNFDITTKNGNETLFALLPRSYHAFKVNSEISQPIENYQTLRGEQLLYKGKNFEFSREIKLPPLGLNISNLSESEKIFIRNLVKIDANKLTSAGEDTYFLGKQLFSLANVLDIAEQLGMASESNLLKTKLRTELEEWKNNTFNDGRQKKYFYYDTIIKGIIGEPSSFGSELFNDHNFHYGYFIYAASILSRYDSEYLNKNADFIDLLVGDIANIDRDDKAFPYMRGFDAYEGHSWASGFGLFADGNNQESSSEAVNAWYAVYLWGNVTNNKNLIKAATYLYAEESYSAQEYWLNIDRKDLRFKNFAHSIVGIIWGGKSDWATWFSPQPEAILGIQLLPISPASDYLGLDRERVRENIMSEKILQNPTMFKDYLAIYKSFCDIDGAKKIIKELESGEIDSANSRTFMEAWLLLHDKE